MGRIGRAGRAGWAGGPPGAGAGWSPRRWGKWHSGAWRTRARRTGAWRTRAWCTGAWRTGRSREVVGFAAAGLAAYAADLALFVWLRGPAGLGPLTAKSASFLVACSVAYAGNALVTYRGRPAGRTPRLRRYGTFFAVNLAGAAVQLLCIAVSHYGLGLTSARADTVSGAGVGMVLGTALRFWGTRTLVFPAGPGQDAPAGPAGDVPPRPAQAVQDVRGVRDGTGQDANAARPGPGSPGRPMEPAP